MTPLPAAIVAAVAIARRCLFCRYEWQPRVAEPKKCPKCQRWQDDAALKPLRPFARRKAGKP
jgi:hypothetical protein